MKHLYFFKRIGLCLGMLFLSLSLSAQSLSYEALSGASSSPSDLSISEVYSNYLAYIDPENKIGTLTSMTTIHSSVNSSNFSGTSMNSSSVMAQYRDTQGRIASAMKMENMTTKTIFDGTDGYTEMDLMGGTRTEMTEDLKAMFKAPDMDLLVRETRIPDGASISKVTAGDLEFYAISYEYNYSTINNTMVEYYNASTFTKDYWTTSSNNSGTKTNTISQYADYQSFDGIMQPVKLFMATASTTTAGDSQTTTQTTLAYKFNETFDYYQNAKLKNLKISLPAIPSAGAVAAVGSPASTAEAAAEIAETASTRSVDADSDQIAAQLKNIDDLENSAYFKSLNLREQAYQLRLRASSIGETPFLETPVVASGNTVGTEEGKARIAKMDGSDAGKLKYRRSSLYTMMVDDNTRERYKVIKDAFGNSILSEKFNDHNIGPYLIPANGMSGEKDQTELIENYLTKNGVARDLVAKWFNRDANGNFNMDLIAERGQYNASEIDVKVAQSSVRGKGLLADAGRELIGNTFVIVYDYKYTNKEEQAKKRGGFLDAISTVASIAGYDDVANIAQGARVVSDVMGKGYFVRTNSYLYRLVWNDDIANEFYSEMWMDESDSDPNRKAIFDRTDLFKLEYVGSEISRNNLQSTIFTSKTDDQLIEIATTRAVDKNIGKLQRSYEEFRVKTPLLSIEPIAAQIGTKEGIEPGDKFEVLEQVLSEDGTTYYDKVGTIKVGRDIWDNAYLADEGESKESEEEKNLAKLSPLLSRKQRDKIADQIAETEAQDNQTNYTTFKGSAKKLAPGMLIRQIN